MTDLSTQRILILGGSGFVGRALCRMLVAKGARHITVPTRRLAHAQGLRVLPGVHITEASVHDDGQLARLLAGQDIVVNLVAILQGSEAAFEATHVAWPRRLVAACQTAGAKRLIHVSALGVDEAAPSRYLRSKARGEAIIRQSPLAWTVLRPSVIFGAEDRFLNLFAQLQQHLPIVPLAGADARFQPVWVQDVAHALVSMMGQPDTIGQCYEAAGPDVLNLAQLVRLAGERVACPRPILPLPAPLAWVQALAMECLPGEPLMSRDNLRSMQVPNVASGRLPGLSALGVRPHSVRVT